jgi:TonB family protein
MPKRTPNPSSLYQLVLFLLVSALFSGTATADLVSGGKAYDSGDYDRAFKDFLELAKLGQPMAQFNVAVMYARGEGARASAIYAYAWATLAAENGVEKAKVLADSLRPKLALAPGSEQIAADIEAQYGHAVLDQHLLPKIVTEENSGPGDRARCRPQHVSFPVYPPEAERQGIQGRVYVEFSVRPDGRSRNPRIIYAVPRDLFDASTRDGLLHTEFAPAAAGSKPVECTMFFQFLTHGKLSQDYPRLDRLVHDTLSKAESGDPGAQMLYGMLLVGLPQLNKPRSQALPWFLKSAQAGLPIAQFQVGYSLLKGWGCDCEENKAVDWLRLAAQGGEADAEVTLAMYALRGDPDEARQTQAKLWLEQAAASGNHDGQLYLAALLAAAPGAETRDPKRALTLLDEVFRGVRDDPTAFEIRAAAQASSGDFKEAVKSENKAISEAQHLKWDLAPLNERLARYTGNQPWYGPLLEF